MDRIHTFNPQRLQWYLADRGVTLEQCAADLGMSITTLEQMLQGEQGPTPRQLQALATYFARGLLFFVEPGPVDERRMRGAQFRTLANQRPELSHGIKALIERVERQREVFLDLRAELAADTELPRFEPPDLAGLAPAQAAARVREWLGLGTRNDFEILRAAIEHRGVLVFRSNGYAGKWQVAPQSSIHGFSLYYRDCPVVFVRKMAVEARQTFTLAHELAHLLLHRASVIDDEADLASAEGMEQEANAFAGHLLVPDAFLARIDAAGQPEDAARFDDWLASHARAWGVSTEVVLRRLADAGRLDRARYGAYHAWRSKLPPAQAKEGGSREYRHREPRHLFGDRYVRLVLHALNANEITPGKASSFLDDVKIGDLHRLESFYASA